MSYALPVNTQAIRQQYLANDGSFCMTRYIISKLAL